MRNLRTAVLAGAAALCAAGTAMAASNDTHVVKVDLPDGSVARIEYKGDVAPKVTIDRGGALPVAWIAAPSPFAAFDRVFADMDRQAAAMLRQAQAIEAFPPDGAGKPDLAAFGGMPAGTVSYRFVTSSDGSRVCTRSWRLTAEGAGQAPKMVSTSSGDCGDAATPAPARGAAPAKAAPAPGTV